MSSNRLYILRRLPGQLGDCCKLPALFCLSSNSTNNFNFQDYAIKYFSKRYWNTFNRTMLHHSMAIKMNIQETPYTWICTTSFCKRVPPQHPCYNAKSTSDTNIPTLKWWVSSLQISPWLLKFRVPFPNFTSNSLFLTLFNTVHAHKTGPWNFAWWCIFGRGEDWNA